MGTDFRAGESDAFAGLFYASYWGIIGTGYVPRIQSKMIVPAHTREGFHKILRPRPAGFV
jgi:hypothetical protein